jgi:hypothetical protein
MLKSILNLSNVRTLSKKEQKNIKGGDSFLCVALCGPGDGNVPIYGEEVFTAPDGSLQFLTVEIACFCA